MTDTIFKKSLTKFLIGFVILVLVFSAAMSVKAQKNENLPEIEVAGIRLNDEKSGRTFLSKYAPRSSPSGQPVYYFYNKYATEVMKLTAFSDKHPHLIVEAEIYSIGKNYREQHFQVNEINSFATESGFFVGVRQSAKSLLFGVAEKTDKEKVIKAKGEPDEITQKEKREVLIYKIADLTLMQNEKAIKFSRYTANYEFYKDTLKKIQIKLELLN